MEFININKFVKWYVQNAKRRRTRKKHMDPELYVGSLRLECIS